LCPDTAGFALPSSKNGGSGIINVFFDRLEQIVQGSKGTAPLELLLGITVAHEIGHLLLPGSPHSRSGIMHARVGEEYLHMAAQGWLGFTVEQRQAIGKNVREWRSQSESKQLASVSTLDAYNSW
jgi:hypothetical protein